MPKFGLSIETYSRPTMASLGAVGDNVAALPTVLPVVNLGRKLASDGAFHVKSARFLQARASL